ncbi:DEAD/DEAH box helicase family protein [Bacillus sp. V3B]|uniref:DEAD/DEAH box helicase family protein n=1 Tax=Bacillus sp. V3B TaxID=2804915 RepID=UPI00210A4658|nr:DEAD/DEAH box helicase family protein [Bacillus sp. V3B]MCQ6274960.1 DEAD/DEAH box helicase family protein [Bacillus sp. V3B]
MKHFPKQISFRYSWRKYQKRVLDELDHHLKNHHLHLVAPPGSGKTVLGLEVMLRVNQPTIILAPTLTIKNQWVSRFMELFLQKDQQPDWVSIDIKNPAFLTITTYQALHSVYKTSESEEEGDEELIDDPIDESDEPAEEIYHPSTIAEKIQEIGFRTIILDEAHHLRTSWWKSTLDFRAELTTPTMVSLTATPPYDVTPQEWQRYIDLCGPIDAEISVAELVREGDLCPHQDYIFLSSPEKEEMAALSQYHQNVARFCGDMLKNSFLIKTIEDHPWVVEPNEHLEEILSQPAYYSSMVIFLKAINHKKWKEALAVLGLEEKGVPSYDREWAEELLNGVLYKDAYMDHEQSEFKILHKELRRIGAEEKKKIYLQCTPRWDRQLVQSASKLNSITNILELENSVLGQDLRMVILTDYIRKDALRNGTEDQSVLKKLGVVPIFELIHSRFGSGFPVGILTGSFVIVPKSAIPIANDCAKRRGVTLHYRELTFDSHYASVDINDRNRSSIVGIMTEVFSRGGMTVIVGTAALLGEGWDAPCINSLIMASYVGSFMLSNQMRGRAIRVDQGNPNKTGAIWHLGCVDPEQAGGGYDLYSLNRRFRSLIGLSVEHDTIESGISRMGIRMERVSKNIVHENNKKTIDRARNRQLLKERWDRAVSIYEEGRMTEEIKTPKERIPKRYVFNRTIKSILLAGIMIFLAVFLEGIGDSYRRGFDLPFSVVVGLSFVIASLYAGPSVFKAAYLAITHQSLESNVHDVGLVLYETLYELTVVEQVPSPKRIKVEEEAGVIACWMNGGTTYEKTLFLNALQEFLEPIENPRYLLYRESKTVGMMTKKDYHAVPEEIGRRKEYAEVFLGKWTKTMGPAQLIYTRNTEGRKRLVEARMKAMSGSFVKKSERISVWR